MPWWGWVTLGVLLLGAELGVVDTGFYLIFIGIAAITVGPLASFGAPPWVQWIAFGVLSLAFLTLFRGRVYALVQGKTGDRPEGVTGEWALAIDHIEPGGTGRVELRGTSWSARNLGTTPIEPGGRVQVERAESILLLVRNSTG